MDIDIIVNVLYATLRTATPLMLVALGEMVCEKSGVLNLGQEGLLLVSAVAGFIVMTLTGNHTIAFLGAIMAGVLLSLVFAFLAITLSANQIASGLALTIFGAGISAFVGTTYVGMGIEGLPKWSLPVLSDIPYLGKILFQHDIIVYFTWGLLALIIWVFKRSRLGLNINAIGENPDAANAIGIPVLAIRYGCVLFGGAMAGLAGGYLSLSYTPMWSEGMSSGLGWIALALVVFASWKAERVLLGACLFGFASILHLVLQGTRFEISPSLMAMLPYVATIIVLVWLSSDAHKNTLSAPRSLGQAYRPQH